MIDDVYAAKISGFLKEYIYKLEFNTNLTKFSFHLRKGTARIPKRRRT